MSVAVIVAVGVNTDGRREALGMDRWSRSSLYEKISLGLFPRPVKLDPRGRAVGWPEREIEAYQRERIEARGSCADQDGEK